MEREAIIHIGTTKTGSTSIQNVCNHYREALLAQGALYPRSPGDAAHQLLTYAAAERKHKRDPDDAVWKGIDPEERMERFEAEFRAEMEGLPAHVDRVIFSDERLSFMLRGTDEIRRVRERLDPYFTRFRVIAYLRRQDSYLASRYSELLRVGAVGEPDHRRRNVLRLQEYDYSHLLGMWAEVFGEKSVRPRIYERAPGRKFDSVDDFLAACGVTLTVTDDPAKTSNPSMNAAGQAVLREVGRMLQERTGETYVGGQLWRRISQAVTKALPGKGWLPSRAEAAEFMARFADSNEAVRARYFPERATLFTDESEMFPVDPAPLGDAEKFEAACAAFLEGMARGLARENKAERGGLTGKAKRAMRLARAARADAPARPVAEEPPATAAKPAAGRAAKRPLAKASA